MIEIGGLPMKIYKNAMKFFAKYPNQNFFISLIAGIGLGFLLTYPVAGPHPVRWGLVFLLMAAVGFWWAGQQKVK
jgi:hypothetical protein